MEVSIYPSLEEAFDKTMLKDVDHTLIRHSYMKGVKISPHIHSDADEYVIASRGHFKIFSEEIIKEFNLFGDSVTVIYYPASREHGLKVLGEKLDYFVLRIPNRLLRS